jgi:thymidylate kinase
MNAFRTLDAAGVRWAVLRGEPMAPRAAADDIDLLVDPSEVNRLDAILAAAGFAHLPAWHHGAHRFYFAYDEPDDRWIKIDALTRLAYHSGNELPDGVSMAVLERRERADGTWRLASDDEFWALILHCVLDRGTVPPHHRERLMLLADADPSGPLRAIVGEPLAALILARARAGDGSGLVALRSPLVDRCARPKPLRRFRASAATVMAPFLKAVERPGIAVALMGPDGAGKSTLAGALAGTLPVRVQTYYAGLYGERFRAARNTGIPGVALASQLAFTWGSYLSAAYQRRRGRITVFDRYAYDALLPAVSGQDGAKGRLRRLLLGRFAPRPDLVLVLDAPTDRLLHRKGDHARADVDQRRDGYRRLARDLGSMTRVELITTDVQHGVARRTATVHIWDALTSRWTRQHRRPTDTPTHRAAAQHGVNDRGHR